MFCARITFFVFLLTLASLTEARAQSKLESDYDLVKTVNASRARYRASLEKLRAHYLKVGNREKASWVAEELRAFHRAPKQAYRLDLDVPSKELRAKKNDVRANQLYLMAMRYKDQGWGTDYGDNQRRAEILLRQLLTWYPESDKIGDAAYQLGDIYEKKPYQQYRRAAWYFERSYQWDSNTQRDSRLRAARIYDLKLTERDRARQLYQMVLQHETDRSRRQEAAERLSELTSK